MSNYEKIDKFLKPKSVGKGSYEVDQVGKIKKRTEIKSDEFIKNELSYFKSSAREKALSDLDEKIYIDSGLVDILNDELAGAFLIMPDNSANRLEKMQELSTDEEFIDYIDSLDLKLMEIISLLDDKKEEAINKRLDYKDFGSYAVDKDIKIEYEKLIDYLNIVSERAKATREYIQAKKINL